MSTRYNFTCDEEMARVLQILAKMEHKSISSVARELILEALEIREDLYLSELAERCEKASEGKPTVSHEDVWKTFDLE
jgi:predicted DNA-binding protein